MGQHGGSMGRTKNGDANRAYDGRLGHLRRRVWQRVYDDDMDIPIDVSFRMFSLQCHFPLLGLPHFDPEPPRRGPKCTLLQRRLKQIQERPANILESREN